MISLYFRMNLSFMASRIPFHIVGFAVTILWMVTACSPTRRLKENEYLLVRNVVVQEGENKNERDDIRSYIQQKPNTKLFGIYRFYLQIYNLPNPIKLAKKKEKQRERLKTKNEKIKLYNSQLPPGKKKKKLKKEKILFGEWLQKIGEAPVLLDSFRIEKSKKQMQLYAQSKGFFRATVRDSVVIKRKKATVYYFVNRGPAYFIDSIATEIPNPSLDYYAATSKTLLTPGMKYDRDKLDKERERLTTLFRDEGYYLFKKEFIRYEADTLHKPFHMNLKMKILNPDYTYSSGDSIKTINEHRKFMYRKVQVFTNFQFGQRDSIIGEPKRLGDYEFYPKEHLKFKPKILSRSIFYSKWGIFSIRDEEKTKRAFADLRNFRYINIRYVPEITMQGDYDWLDCIIELTPSPKQNIGAELQGTNTEGNLGISVGLSYQNRNIFKGAEILEFRVNGGMEVNVIQGDSTTIQQTGGNPFNTLEVGAQLSLLTPRFLFPIPVNRVAKWTRPKTRTGFSFNYQQRPDFTRYISSFAFGYEWNQSINRSDVFIKHSYNPIEISVISIDPDSSFIKYIETVNDQFVRNSFRNHFIWGGSYTFLFNSQQVSQFKDFLFFRFNAQLGGNLMNLISAIGQDPLVDGYHTMFGIRYAQYVRGEFDFRYYKIFNAKHNLAFRAMAGFGLPYGNSLVLPFEKSFFIGGANDLRAWLPRTLGPGSFAGLDSGRVDQVGDIKLLGNIEYRFKIYRFLEGALFMDAGNIWLIRADADRPNGEFVWERFYREFALGGGAGIRLNLGFFIFRVDIAVPFRDPTKPLAERWVITSLKPNQIRVNIGIGYPF